MALESYVLTQQLKTPYVRVTGMPHKPTELLFKTFKKGEIINGELKHANNKPAFVLVEGKLVIPLAVVKKVVTKEIVSGADGAEKTESPKEKPTNILTSSNPKVKYLDALIIGTLVGVGGVYFAEKQGWLNAEEKKNKIYGGVVGALMGIYLVYRFKTNQPVKPKSKD